MGIRPGGGKHSRFPHLTGVGPGLHKRGQIPALVVPSSGDIRRHDLCSHASSARAAPFSSGQSPVSSGHLVERGCPGRWSAPTTALSHGGHLERDPPGRSRPVGTRAGLPNAAERGCRQASAQSERLVAKQRTGPVGTHPPQVSHPTPFESRGGDRRGRGSGPHRGQRHRSPWPQGQLRVFRHRRRLRHRHAAGGARLAGHSWG